MTNSLHKQMPFVKYLLAGLVGVLAVAGLASAAVLLKGNQDIRQQAAGYASCYGNVPHGGKTCSGFNKYVVCNNGLFQPPQSCGNNQMCQSGVCVPVPPRDCAVTENQTLPNGARACQDSRVQITCEDGTWVPKLSCATGKFCVNGECQDQRPTVQPVIFYPEKVTKQVPIPTPEKIRVSASPLPPTNEQSRTGLFEQDSQRVR